MSKEDEVKKGVWVARKEVIKTIQETKMFPDEWIEEHFGGNDESQDLED